MVDPPSPPDPGPAHPPVRPLRVVQVVRSDAFAGVERYVCQVANGLAARGHHLEVIGGDPQRMRAELDGAVAFIPAVTVLQAARALAGRHHTDIVHAHMTAAEAAAWLARPFQRAPVVATRHFPGPRGSGGLARSLTRITTRAVARDIAISRFVAEGVGGPTVLLYSAVADRPQAGLEAPTVVMLQRLTEEKRTEVGVRAWAASGLAAAGWRMVVAGSGDRLDSLTALAGELGVADSIEFAGQITDTDGLLARSSIFLATTPVEAFGFSVVEAMAHGLPVVAARGGAHPETVGDQGVLFDPGDASAAAEGLALLAGDPALRRRMGGDLRQRQRRLFSMGAHLDGLERIYHEVIDGGAHG